MRFSARRTAIAFVVCLLVFALVMMMTSGPAGNEDAKFGCRVPERVRSELHALLSTTHEVLQDLRLTHFLCYGSLWGQLRRGKRLPWMDSEQLCLLNEQLTALEEAYLLRAFRNKALKLRYDSQEGEYHVTSSSGSPRDTMTVTLVVFERAVDVERMRRVGWKRRILPPSCEMSPSLHCFPSRLVEEPLTRVNYDGLSLSVPREEAELQKYLYPDDWWKRVAPPGCENVF